MAGAHRRRRRRRALFSYELKYIKAKDLADRLAEVFGGGGSGGQQTGGDGDVR